MSCHCLRCRGAAPSPFWITPSQLQELLTAMLCPQCGTATCEHAKDHDAFCMGPVPAEPLELQWYSYLDGTYVMDTDNG